MNHSISLVHLLLFRLQNLYANRPFNHMLENFIIFFFQLIRFNRISIYLSLFLMILRVNTLELDIGNARIYQIVWISFLLKFLSIHDRKSLFKMKLCKKVPIYQPSFPTEWSVN